MTDLVAVRNQLIEVRADLDSAINALSLVEAAAPVPSPVEAPVRRLVWGARVSADFRSSVLWIESQLKLNADNLMACMAFETGVTFSPSKRNPASTATGLIQFMRATALNLGTTTEALAKMTAVRQLAFVYKYFKGFGSDHSDWDLADTYMAILLPSMLGKPLDSPMNWSQSAHNVNKGLDKDRSGWVTKREAYQKVKDMYDLGSQPENMA